MSILVKIWENFYFSQNYQKDFDVGENFKEISILVKIYKISNLVKILEKCRFWLKLSEILDFGQNLPNCWFWTKLQKLLIIVKFFEKCWSG